MVEINQPMRELMAAVAAELVANDMRLVTAESCTGGMVAAEITAYPGCSDWFEGGFVTYRLSAKEQMIGVKRKTLETFGAVSEPTAREMAEGALAASDAQISVSVTGVAGPDGGNLLTPVGTVWFGWAVRNPDPVCLQTSRYEFSGNREEVRVQAVRIALEGVRTALAGPPR